MALRGLREADRASRRSIGADSRVHLRMIGHGTGTPAGHRDCDETLSDASVLELCRQLSYKCVWYGSVLVEADAYYPYSLICHECGNLN